MEQIIQTAPFILVHFRCSSNNVCVYGRGGVGEGEGRGIGAALTLLASNYFRGIGKLYEVKCDIIILPTQASSFNGSETT